MKRVWALLFAVAVLALAAVLAHAVGIARVKTVRREAARAAEAGGVRATDALVYAVAFDSDKLDVIEG